MRRMVYICSPFRGDEAGNTKRARRYARTVVLEGHIPIAPHLLFPQFMDEERERDLALEMNLELLRHCDELRIFGECITDGMKIEIETAKALGIPIKEIFHV